MDRDSGDSQRTGMVQWHRALNKIQRPKTLPRLVNDLSPSHLDPFRIIKLKRMVRLVVMGLSLYFHPKLIDRKSHSANLRRNDSLVVETKGIKMQKRAQMGKPQPTLTFRITHQLIPDKGDTHHYQVEFHQPLETPMIVTHQATMTRTIKIVSLDIPTQEVHPNPHTHPSHQAMPALRAKDIRDLLQENTLSQLNHHQPMAKIDIDTPTINPCLLQNLVFTNRCLHPNPNLSTDQPVSPPVYLSLIT